MKISNINGHGEDIIKNAYSKARDVQSGDFERMLEQAKKEKDDKKLKEACTELETVFVNMIFKRMRDTVPRGNLIPESMGEQVFRSMLDEELVRKVSKGEGTGIAKMLYDQLSQNQNK